MKTKHLSILAGFVAELLANEAAAPVADFRAHWTALAAAEGAHRRGSRGGA